MHLEDRRRDTNFSSWFNELLRMWVVYWYWCLVCCRKKLRAGIQTAMWALHCGPWNVSKCKDSIFFRHMRNTAPGKTILAKNRDHWQDNDSRERGRKSPSVLSSISIHSLLFQNLIYRHPMKKCHPQASSPERKQKVYEKAKADLINSHKKCNYPICLGCSTDIGLKLSGVDAAVFKQRDKLKLWKYQCINMEHKMKLTVSKKS